MKKLYSISSMIIAAVTGLIFFIMTVNEELDLRIFATVGFSIAALIFSVPSSFISRFVVKNGDKIEGTFRKTIYYFIVFIASILILAGCAGLIFAADDLRESSNELSVELGHGLFILFLIIVSVIGTSLPFLQTMIVLGLRNFSSLSEEKY